MFDSVHVSFGDDSALFLLIELAVSSNCCLGLHFSGGSLDNGL